MGARRALSGPTTWRPILGLSWIGTARAAFDRDGFRAGPMICEHSGMDPQSIDQAYSALQQEFNEVAQALQGLAGKLSAAAGAGDQHAQEWLLDLKGLALNIKSEQMQVQNLLSQIHGFVDSQHQQYQQQMPAYQQQYVRGGGGGLGGLLNSNFGRAIEWGAGFGIGDDLINSLF